MSSRNSRRVEMGEAVRRAFGRYGAAHALLTQAVAERLGLNGSDLGSLGILMEDGPLTPTQIAEVTGLTSGAVTGVIDRLEKAGFVSREADREDRRRVMVRVRSERMPEVAGLYQPLVEDGKQRMASLSDDELGLVAKVLNASAEMSQRHASALRRERPAPEAEDPTVLSAPLGGRTSARLLFKGGAAHLTVRGGAPAGLLYQAGFEGRSPSVRLEGDTVSVEYPRFRALDWRAHRGQLALAAGPAWDLQIRGGSAKVQLQLESLSLASLELSGGVSDLAVSLPRPEGRRRLRITGGANSVSVVRPAGVAARLHLTGGAARLALDSQRLGAVGGEVRLESEGAASAGSAWDIEVSGGASALAVSSR